MGFEYLVAKLGKLLDVVRGFADKGEIVGGELLVVKNEGRLSFDDTAAKYLPSFDNDQSRGITARHLLTHTGGLPLSSIMGMKESRRFERPLARVRS